MLATSYQLMNAISSNSIKELNEFIELGGDVNAKCNFPYGLLNSERGSTTSQETKFSSAYSGSYLNVPVLHQAVRACYDRVHGGPRRDQAFTVLEKLLENGADPKIQINHCKVCNISGSLASWKIFEGGTALEFADFLLQHNIDSVQHHSVMDKVKKLLRGKMIKLNKRKASVLESTAILWKDILHDNDFYDISFKCSDGEIVHAHKPILAAASAYFRTMFLGSWKEMTDNVIELKETSSTTMKILLKYIYTGSLDIDSTKLEEEIILLFPLAYQYMITPLQEICEHQCTEMLDHAHIVDIMQLARLHSATKLQLSCFEYVQKQAASLMVQPGFMALATADPELWRDLTKYITSTTIGTTTTIYKKYSESNSSSVNSGDSDGDSVSDSGDSDSEH